MINQLIMSEVQHLYGGQKENPKYQEMRPESPVKGLTEEANDGRDKNMEHMPEGVSFCLHGGIKG